MHAFQGTLAEHRILEKKGMEKLGSFNVPVSLLHLQITHDQAAALHKDVDCSLFLS